MPTVTTVFFSGTGHTTALAEAVQAGAGSVADVESESIAITGEDIRAGRYRNEETLARCDASDAIIFGTPTYMGCVSGQMKCFLDATAPRFYTRAWLDKIAGGFTCSAGPSGDKLNSLQTLVTFAMQHGMIWVGLECFPFNEEGLNRWGFFIGAGGQAVQEPPTDKPDAADRETARLLGERVAKLTRRIVD